MHKMRPCLIQTSRLQLHAIAESDAADMCEIFTHPLVKQTYMLPDLESTEAQMKLFSAFQTLSLREDRFVYGIYLEDRVIGFVNDVEITETSIELGYVIHPAHHNCGFATEALQACIQALHTMGFETVRTGAFQENPASIRVMEKSGMTRLAETEIIPYRGKDHLCVYFEKRKNA